MTVAIEARALSARGGVARYLSQLLPELAALGEAKTVHVILDAKPRRPMPNNLTATIVPRMRGAGLALWLHWQVPRVMRGIAPQVVHYTKADVPFRSRREKWRTVVTVYDIIPLLFVQGQTLMRRWYWPAALRRAVTLSDHIITISEASKYDIARHLHVPLERVTVIPLAVDAKHFWPTPRRLYDFPYILYVGARDPRKNVPGLLRAFAAVVQDVPHQLVVAGCRRRPDDGAAAEVRRLGLDDRVIWREFIPHLDLPALYAGADAFVWPSIYEGWGFPPQEAMACGTPVIVSDGGALPEVVGSAGLVVPFTEQALEARRYDAAFERDLAAAMLQLLGDQPRRAAMRAAGLAHVRQFSWQSVAQQTMDVYRWLL